MAFACAAVLWLVWLHRAYTNLVFVGSKRVRFSPTWAVAYWFVPFVNVVRAYQVMKDLWLRSDSRNDRDGYDDLPAPVLLRGWWGVSLAWGVLEPVFTVPVGSRTRLPGCWPVTAWRLFLPGRR